MTDSDIIKALEYCANHSCCDGCPFEVDGRCVNTNTSVYYKAVLDIINRQKAEISRLKGNSTGVSGTPRRSREYNEMREMILRERLTKAAKAKVIKEYAKRLKKEMMNLIKEVIEGDGNG